MILEKSEHTSIFSKNLVLKHANAFPIYRTCCTIDRVQRSELIKT